MLKRILSICLCTLTLAAAAFAQAPVSAPDDAGAHAPVKMLRLRDGSLQWGTIQSHDTTGVVFQRLDTGGLLRLDWSRLDPAEEKDLRTQYGYVDLTSEELMIQADRLVTIKGVELIGKIVDRTADAILLKTASATIPVPKNQIAQASELVWVPAREVYTLDELYAQERSAVDVTTPDGNFRLAQYCEGFFDFTRAIEHYKKVSELDPVWRKAEVQQSLARATEKAKAQAELEYLSEIDQLSKRNRFDEALVLADAFKDRFPQSALFADAKRKRERVLKARDEYLTAQVARVWQAHLGKLARESASKPLEEVMAYVDDKLKVDLVAAVLKDIQKTSPQATEDSVRQLWKSRKKVRYQTASYGLGTWLLGKAAALKGYEEEDTDAKPASEMDQVRAKLEDKIKRFFAAQAVSRAAQSQDEQKDDRQTTWQELSPTARAGWIVAWFVENSGEFEIYPKPIVQACKECGGKGIIEYSLAGANVSKSAVGKQSTDLKRECESCHGVGAVRRVMYR
jgi:hypothetical protein